MSSTETTYSQISQTGVGRRRQPMRSITAAAAGLCVAALLLAALGSLTGLLSVKTISTGSMTGTADPGSLVVGWRTPADDLRVGEVVTTPRPDAPSLLVTHRIVDIDHQADGAAVMHLRGDANPVPDVAEYPVRSAWHVIAIVPRIGVPVRWLCGSGLWLVVGGVVAWLLLRRREACLEQGRASS